MMENTSEPVELSTSGKHTIHGLNFYMSYFDDVAKVLPREAYCFIVGGWVRDRILGEPVGYNVDVDMLVTCDPVKVAKDLAARIGGDFFVFEKKGFLIKRPVVATVILNLPPYRYRFDFSHIKDRNLEKNLEEDLRDRDFTANAIAVNLDDVLSIGAKQTILFDPTGGIKDLERGLLRPVSLKNLEKDPVRILRGFRIAIEKGLELTEDFYKFVREKADLIQKAPPERITYELFKIMRNPNSSEIIRRIYETGLLEKIIPEMADLRKVRDQGGHHIYPLDEHTLKTLESLERILKEESLPRELMEGLGKMEVLGEFSDVELLKWSALLHDIGKPITCQIKDGRVTFYNHDKVGQDMVKEIGKKLRWGEQATRFVSDLVRHHLRVFYLRESMKRGQLKNRGMAKFWRDCERITPHLFLLSLADARASGDSREEIEDLLETIKKLVDFRRSVPEETLRPLLDGHRIMEILNIPPGKTVGLLKSRLLEAQMEGRVKTKEEAEEFVREEFKKIR